jgi:hypothetical protein
MADAALQIQQSPTLPQSANETAASSVAASAAAMVQARYVMAYQRPRNIDEVRLRLLKECKRPYFASVAVYHKPIGKGIEGPSIRLAETAARLMGNILVQTPAVYDDNEKRIVKVMASDLETNTTYEKDVTITKTVERRKTSDGDQVIRTRTNKRGDTLYIIEANDDDILNKENALISKTMRTLLLRLVPGDLIDEALEQVYRTREDEDAKDPDAARRRVLDALSNLGIMPKDLEAYLGHDVGKLTPTEVDRLRSIFVAIRDGETNWNEVIGAPGVDDAKADDSPKQTQTSKTLDLLNKRRVENELETPAKKDEGEPPHDPVTGEVKPTPATSPQVEAAKKAPGKQAAKEEPKAPELSHVLEQIRKAASEDDLKKLMTNIEWLPEKAKAVAIGAYSQRRAEIEFAGDEPPKSEEDAKKAERIAEKKRKEQEFIERNKKPAGTDA